MNLKKNKFIIGLSTTLLASVVAAGGEVAHASALPEQTDLTPTNDIIENVVDEYNQVVDDTEPEQPTEENSDSAETNEAEVSKEESAQASDSSEAAQADATDENEASTTNETEQTDTEEKTDQASETISKEEALLTEPTATTEDPATDENLDAVVEAGAVPEDGADTANTEADTADEASNDKAQELEANTADSTNKETAAATSTELKDDANVNADTPQETLAGDEPKDPEAGDAPIDGDDLPLTEGGSDLAETEQGAELAETEKGAETPAGEANTKKPADTDPKADEAKIENYRTTDLPPEGTEVYGNISNQNEERDGFKFIVVEPSNNTTDKRLYGYELIIDKKTGQRTYTWIEINSSVSNRAPVELGDKPMMVEGEKLYALPEVNYKAEGTSKLVDGPQLTYGYAASEEDLKHINNNDYTVLGMKDRYTKDNASGLKVLNNPVNSTLAVLFKVNPWPNENDNLEPIKLQGDYNEKVFVKGQTIETGLQVEHVDANAKERLVGKVYHPITGEVVPGAEAYINDEGYVFVKLPAGAIDDKGNINKDSIFYKESDYKGLQNLEVKFYARPRTAGEFNVIANEYTGFVDGSVVPASYVDTDAGTTEIVHKGEAVPIANQGIDRYDHYNLIGEFNINLDDTKYYNQDFNYKNGVDYRSIIAADVRPGIEYSVDLKYDPKSADPYKKSAEDMAKANKNKEAVGSIDFRFIEDKNKGKADDDKWDIEVDYGADENGAKTDIPVSFKITPPKSARPGESIGIPIEYTYTNGSTDIHWFHFIVQESDNNIPVYEAKTDYPSQTQETTPDVPVNDKKLPPDSYSIANPVVKDDHGNEWDVSIDKDTGLVSATPKDPNAFVGGEKLKVPVKVTYIDKEQPDEVIEENVNAEFFIKVKNNLEPHYNAKAGTQGVTLESSPIVAEAGVNSSRPTSYTLAPNQVYTDDKGNTWNVSIDETTGIVSATVPEGTDINGALLNVKVTAHYAEGKEKEVEVQFVASGTNGTKTITEKADVPFETIIQFDNTLKAGEQEVVQEGKVGEKSRDVTLTIKDSVVTDTKTSDYTQTIPPQNKIIKVGTMTTGVVKDEEEIPFRYEVEYDSSIEAGKYEIIVKGQPGKRTTEWTIRNSEVVGQPKETVVDPVNAVIKVGNKDFTGEVKHTEDFAIPYAVEVRYRDDLPVGTTNVVQDGKAGSYKVTYTQNIKNGETTGELVKTESNRVEAKNHIIEIGTKAVEPNKTTVTSPVQPEIDLVYNPDLDKGVVQKGEITPGEVKTVITTTRDPETGQLVTKEETVQTAPRQQIIIGTKDFTGDYKYTEEKIDEYKTTVIFDSTLAPGKEEIETPGVNGVSRREVTVPITNGTAGTPSYGNYEEVTKRQDQVIRVGTRTDGKHTVTEVIPYGYTIEEVDTLPKGEYREVSPGQAGSRTVEYEIVNSKVVEGSAKEISKSAPVNAVIQVGKGTLNGSHTITETEVVPYETEIVFDDTLKAGEQDVVNEGSNGSKSREVTLTIQDGKVVATDEGAYTQNTAPVNRKVRVGTQTTGTITHEEKIPFNYDITYDPTVPAGTYVEDVKGVEGTRTSTWTITNSNPVKTNEVVNGPTNAKIRVGTKDFTGTVTNTTTEPIPYKVIVKENPEMLLGTHKTVTEGVVGSKEVTYNIPVKNGSQDPDGTVTKSEEIKTEAIDQVIEVGTKPVAPVKEDVSEDVNVVVEYKFDPELPKGETRTGELTPGKVENVVTTEYNPQTGQMETREDKKVTPAVQTIYVGSKDLTGPFSYEVEKDIPFTTIYELDPTLDAGTEKVSQVGENGTKVIKTTADLVNGRAENSKIEETITKEPKPQIIKVGTKPVNNDTINVEKPIVTDFEVIYDDTKEKGYVEISDPVPGKVETRIVEVFNPETGEIETTTEEVVVTNPKQTITIGTKDFEGSQSTEVTKVVPFETEYIYDDTLASGERVIDQEGSNGEMIVTYTTKVKNGSAYDTTVTENVTTEPTKQIVRIGTKEKVVDTKTEVVKESIPFETEYKYDDTLAAGTYEVDEEGKLGEKTTTTTTTIINGESTSNTTEETTKDPVNRVVRIGTKIDRETKDVVSTNTYEIPFETKVTYDPNLKAGEEIVKAEGENGSRTVTVTVPVVDGKAGEPVVEDKVTKEPTTREVVIGTKDTSTNTSTVVNVTKEEIPFEIEYVKDDTLAAGETRVETVGKNGKKITTTTLVNENGKSETKTEETTEDAVKQVVRVGTKVEDKKLDNQDFEKKFTREIPFATEIEYDENLAAGTEQVVQEGKNGSREITVKVSVRDGIASEPVVTDNITPATPKKIKIGTMKTDTVTTVTETVKPFETEIVYDNTMDKGTSKVTQTGVNGKEIKTTVTTVINGKAQDNPVVTTSSTEPTKQIITVGTKCPDSTTTVDTVVDKVTPYEVTIIYDDTLDKGTEVVVTEGRVGIVRETHTVEVKNGVAGESKITKTETIQEKQDKVIRIGTKPTTPTTPETPKEDNNEIVSVTEVPEQFETEIIYDDTLPAGKVIEDKEGINGVRTITTTIKITDGKAETIVTEEVTKEAQKRIIRIGTKTPTNNDPIIDKKIVEIPSETIVTSDPDLEERKARIIRPGQKGEKTITTITKIVNGKEVTEVVEVITKQPVDEIRIVGTKVTIKNPVGPKPSADDVIGDISKDNDPDIPRTSYKSDNPKTGIAGTGATLTALGISIAGLGLSKKKKEEDEEK